ncbi:MAG TPA: hypothetical protein GXZ95_00840 [Mollicutes bacterium]|nr:hypothetical protein [Mollicutes bacterium]
MPVDVQIKSILLSILFGILFCIALRINYRYIKKTSVILCLIVNLLFVLDFVLLYFTLLKYINGGIVHSYFLIAIVFGFIITELYFKKRGV